MVKMVIFDFDGTIADTLDVVLAMYNRVAEKHSLQQIDLTDKKNLAHMSAFQLVSRFRIMPWKWFGLVREIRKLLRTEIADVEMFNGIDELFKALDQQDIEIGIVTTNSKENVEIFLKKHRISNIKFIRSERNLFGKGRVLSKIIKSQRLSTDEVVYVGDELRDFVAAKQARVKMISVTWGYNSETSLRSVNPQYTVSSPKEVLELLNK